MKRPASLLIVTGAVVVAGVGLSSDQLSVLQKTLLLTGALLSSAALIPMWRTHRTGRSSSSDSQNADLREEREAFAEWQQSRLAELQEQSERLAERERDLAVRYAAFQEFLEYPDSRAEPTGSEQQTTALSAADRRVFELLEQEAERFYEKIRGSDYYRDGKVDIAAVRNDLIDLIRRIAAVYSPDSTNPLLETSFEQLARAISRLCLHVLVMLEQLPLEVQRYNINDLYRYFRRAAVSYGAYQKAAPWLKNLSRAGYIGKLAAGANPVTLAAWWLATEAGRFGTRKVVESVVDRQAVAVMHDLVTLVGVEVCNIYGPGFRQRDPAWILGAELTELLSQFPVSRESLRAALQTVTRLPLRSEYDRIYLYRCIAEHKPSGLLPLDPAIVTREQRERIAQELEEFFRRNIHGVTDSNRNEWREAVESRLDLRLKLEESARPHKESQSVAAAAAVFRFLQSVVGLTPEEAVQRLGDAQLLQHLSDEERGEVLSDLKNGATPDRGFHPPDLDPGSEVAGLFLKELVTCAMPNGDCDEHVEQLLTETICYFRRSVTDAASLLHGHRVQLLTARCDAGVSLKRLPEAVIRVLTAELQNNERLVRVYDEVQMSVEPAAVADSPAEIDPMSTNSTVVSAADESSADESSADRHAGILPPANLFLCCLRPESNAPIRCILIDADQQHVIWISAGDAAASRIRGRLIDDCEIRGGKWLHGHLAGHITVPGSLTGGGFTRMFGLLMNPD
ncbi:MAG: hypothetical protein KDA89_15750 [Planctomycetaceae bacterium]|nr:hypothetical protein [Planctomycetaceae bacterium]